MILWLKTRRPLWLLSAAVASGALGSLLRGVALPIPAIGDALSGLPVPAIVALLLLVCHSALERRAVVPSHASAARRTTPIELGWLLVALVAATGCAIGVAAALGSWTDAAAVVRDLCGLAGMLLLGRALVGQRSPALLPVLYVLAVGMFSRALPAGLRIVDWPIADVSTASCTAAAASFLLGLGALAIRGICRVADRSI
ncbi:MAG: hypothetical protein QM635_04120 [Microbacteriaceae bacterium]